MGGAATDDARHLSAARHSDGFLWLMEKLDVEGCERFSAVLVESGAGGFSLGLIDADFGFLVSAIGDSEVETVEIGAEKAGARAGSGGDLCNALILVG